MPEPSSIWDDTYRYESDQIPPDPLLGSDSFIAATNDFANQNGGVKDTEQPSQSEPFTPSKEKQQKRPLEAERPDWLPEGWKMTSKTRTNGASAGSTDRYYIEPTSGHRFRSKNEVLRFLETGSKVKRKLDTDGNVTNSETPGGHKEKKKNSGSKSKKSGTKSKKPAPWNFDFQNPPEEVNWALVDVSQGLWKPSIGDQRIPESSKQEWTTTFERICDMMSTST